MDRRLLLAAARVLLAVLTGIAIVAQLAQSSDAGTLVPINFASYFTIQSNVIGLVVFLVGAARWRGPSTPGWDLVRGASALNLTVTYVVFALLLSNTDVDVALPWVNTVVHTVFPLAVIVDWLIDPPATPIPWARALRWMAYPLLWLGYTMVRGAIAGWYPYPFLDPSDGGYGTVALYVVAILVFGLVVVAVLRFAGNALQERRLIPAATGTSAG